MTYHRRAQVVACHYCGLKRTYRDDCPSCGSYTLEEIGKGTERIEEAIRDTFPGVGLSRMDSDTTAVRGSHHNILSEFRAGKTKILVGTQIVAKGHDFPGVHTAVVISADHGLYSDFRSSERTFALMVQLAGRAGRGARLKRLFTDIYAEPLRARKIVGPRWFLRPRNEMRSMLRYPPFSRLVLLRI